MKSTRTFSIFAIFVAAALIMAMSAGHSLEPVKVTPVVQLQSAPAGTVYAVTSASEIQWRPTFDVNPDAVHDLSMPRD